jgi:hypothetical protein
VPAFAMLRLGAGTIGLLSLAEAQKEGVEVSSPAQKAAVHVEFTTDDLEACIKSSRLWASHFISRPTTSPGSAR